MSFVPSIFTILFLRKSFWMTTLNAFFIFYTPFSRHFFSRYIFSTFFHYVIMRENKKEKYKKKIQYKTILYKTLYKYDRSRREPIH